WLLDGAQRFHGAGYSAQDVPVIAGVAVMTVGRGGNGEHIVLAGDDDDTDIVVVAQFVERVANLRGALRSATLAGAELLAQMLFDPLERDGRDLPVAVDLQETVVGHDCLSFVRRCRRWPRRRAYFSARSLPNRVRTSAGVLAARSIRRCTAAPSIGLVMMPTFFISARNASFMAIAMNASLR